MTVTLTDLLRDLDHALAAVEKAAHEMRMAVESLRAYREKQGTIASERSE